MLGSKRPYLGDTRKRTASRGAGAPPEGEWGRFCAVKPKYFVRENSGVLDDAQEMRARAVDFIVEASGRVSSESLKAQIVEAFVSRVERERRTSLKSATKVDQRRPSADFDDQLLFR